MRSSKLLTLGGGLLLAAALCVAGYDLWTAQRAARSVRQVLTEMADLPPAPAQTSETPPPAGPELPHPAPPLLDPNREMPVTEVDGNEYIGVLELPALELSLPVMSRWSYPRLKLAPCRYKGSAYRDDLILAAHNYPSHFGSLHKLAEGDEVAFTDAEGNLFLYQVAQVEELQATAVEEMESGDWDLTLFTCTVGGQARVTVRCDRLE